MADEITIGSKAIKEVQDLRVELIKLSSDALAAGKSLSTITTPGGLNKSGADNAKTIADLDKLKTKYSELNDTIVKKAEQSRLAEIRLQQQREKSFDSFEKNAKKEEEALKKSEGAYQRYQNSVNAMTKTYNDLAIRKELGNTLTAKEEKQLASLSTRINTYQTALKSVDSQIGKNQRNVGNYASGYNALGNSINQLTREAPAFANSINTGFMAISNNIPALTDAIKGIREQNKLLAAEGKPTQSVLSQLAGSFFSWQTAISLGITLLTVYGGKFIEWISNTDKEKEALDRLTASMKRQNDQLKEANETLEHQNVLAVENAKQRGASIKEIQSLDKAVVENQLKNFERIRDARKRDLDDYVKSELKKRINYSATPELLERVRKFILAEKSLQKNAFIEAENAVKAQGKVLSELTEKQQTSIVEAGKKKSKKEKNPDIEQLESSLKSVGTVINQVSDELSRLFTEKIITDDPEKLKVINFQIEQLTKLKEQLNNVPTASGEIINTTQAKKSTADLKALTNAMREYLGSFTTEFVGNMGFTETFKMLNGEIEGFGKNWQVTTVAIMESAQEMYSFITQNSEGNFNAEKERLQSQYDVSLKYAGDSKEAQEKLADDLEKQKKDIANREAKAKQKQAIFNIAIDTAQALIGLWAKPGFPAAIPLAVVVGALGAAQIAMVASQEVPQYWMGGTHDGGLMMVNDGAGSNYKETIVTPDGKIMKPQGRNVIMDAPAGTEIFTADQWNNTLNDMLQGKGISMNMPHQYTGITKEDMYNVMADTLGAQPQYHSVFDADGATDYIVKGGNRTVLKTNRGNAKGKKY